MDWFLYDNGLRHERVKSKNKLSNGYYFKSLTTRIPSGKDVLETLL